MTYITAFSGGSLGFSRKWRENVFWKRPSMDKYKHKPTLLHWFERGATASIARIQSLCREHIGTSQCYEHNPLWGYCDPFNLLMEVIHSIVALPVWSRKSVRRNLSEWVLKLILSMKKPKILVLRGGGGGGWCCWKKVATGEPNYLRQQSIGDYSWLRDAFVEKVLKVCKNYKRKVTNVHSIRIAMFEDGNTFAGAPF